MIGFGDINLVAYLVLKGQSYQIKNKGTHCEFCFENEEEVLKLKQFYLNNDGNFLPFVSILRSLHIEIRNTKEKTDGGN